MNNKNWNNVLVAMGEDEEIRTEKKTELLKIGRLLEESSKNQKSWKKGAISISSIVILVEQEDESFVLVQDMDNIHMVEIEKKTTPCWKDVRSREVKFLRANMDRNKRGEFREVQTVKSQDTPSILKMLGWV